MILIGWLTGWGLAVHLYSRVAGMAVVGGRQEPRLSGGGDDIPVLSNGGTAWTEQAYLRMADISHRVENSGHSLEPLLKDGHYMVSSIHSSRRGEQHGPVVQAIKIITYFCQFSSFRCY